VKSRCHGLSLDAELVTLHHRQCRPSLTPRDEVDLEVNADVQRQKMAGMESAQQASLVDESGTEYTGIHSLQLKAPSVCD